MLQEQPTLVGPLLSDGTSLRELIDVDKREVSLRVMTDPELYQLELERIFTKAWIGVAHESEIPNPGDFVTRTIGEDRVIVTRGNDNNIEVLLNVCTHKGMEVCRSDAGNTTKFRCPYHGWVFGSEGDLLAAPLKKEMFGDAFDSSVLGLRRARTGSSTGMVFATWNEQAPSLEDYLGPMKWYLDAMFDRTDGGFEVVGPPQRFVIPANWKCATEQWSGDGYHVLTLHRTLEELGLVKIGPKELWGTNVATPEGHMVRCFNLKDIVNMLRGADAGAATTMEALTLLPPSGMTSDMVDQLERHLDEDQMKMLAESPPVLGSLFPQWMFWNGFGFKGGAVTRLNSCAPLGPNSLEITSWALIEKGASQQTKDLARKTSILTAGTSGFIEQDDAEVWPGMQRSAQGVIGRQQSLKYLSLIGENRPDDWVGEGQIYQGLPLDDTQWKWWLRYLEYMTGDPW